MDAMDRKKNSTRRFVVILAVMALGAAYILGKAIQTMSSPMREYWEAVDARFVSDSIPIPAKRGDLLSDDGRVLSTSLPEYRLYLDLRVQDKDSLSRAMTQHFRDSVVDNHVDEIARGLARIFPGYSPRYFRDKIVEARRKCMTKTNGRYPGPVRLYPRMATYVQYRECKRLPLLCEGRFRSGFYGETVSRRTKPYGQLAARTLGDLYPDSGRAKNGLELAFDSILRGTPGIMHRTKVRDKRVSLVDVEPQDGHDLVTTIDIDVQDVADRALRSKLKEKGVKGEIGMAMVMEVATGDVKAIVNLKRGADGEYHEVHNHLVNDLMEPGSTFKTASVMVAMEDGKINKDTRVDTGSGIWPMYGRTMKDHNWKKRGFGMLNVTRVLMKSSNIGVSRLIDGAYHDCPDRFVRGLNNLGVGLPMHLDIPGSGTPRVYMPKKDKSGHWMLPVTRHGKPMEFGKPDLAWMSIGYTVQFPPIYTLAFYNGIANNGRMMKPRFVTRELADGEVVREFPPEVFREKMCSRRTLDAIHEILDSVVMNPEGLGRPARQDGGRFRVSGKTGTAQIADKKGGYHNGPVRYMVSFCGYFPSEKPKYSCLVCIVKTGMPASGGGQCGPVFCEISQYLMTKDMYSAMPKGSGVDTLGRADVARGPRAKAQQVLDMLGSGARVPAGTGTSETGGGVVPDLRGMGARDAVQALSRLGMKARMSGCGRVVGQSVAPGTKAVRGHAVLLTLK